MVVFFGKLLAFLWPSTLIKTIGFRGISANAWDGEIDLSVKMLSSMNSTILTMLSLLSNALVQTNQKMDMALQLANMTSLLSTLAMRSKKNFQLACDAYVLSISCAFPFMTPIFHSYIFGSGIYEMQYTNCKSIGTNTQMAITCDIRLDNGTATTRG